MKTILILECKACHKRFEQEWHGADMAVYGYKESPYLHPFCAPKTEGIAFLVGIRYE